MYEVLVNYTNGLSVTYKSKEISHSEISICLVINSDEHMFIPYTAVQWYKVKKIGESIITPKRGIIHG